MSPHDNIFRGDEVILQCTATGTGNLTYSWMQDAKALITSNATIVINSANIEHSGTYVCTVSNGIITKSSNAEVVDVMCKYIFNLWYIG